ncbi:MAG TPA: ubiquinol oxidase subunit II [Gammaproteobacteria bacterium]|jgi:cytochrome o ubiquinol oxidase subunit 2|nr:ubiquinol oxidase subunit II [Gammaproteobacteria bacterium]
MLAKMYGIYLMLRVALGRLLKLSLMILTCVAICSLAGCDIESLGMLNPKGIVAFEERKILFDTLALMLIVVLPVIVMSITFVYHYKQSHRIRDYKPRWSHSYFLESLWWGIPCAIIVVLAIITWKETHRLDPYQRLAGHPQKPMLVQAIALPWKWLFIYPEQGIATVNYLQIPVGEQVEYWITADNVAMSAFFIPQLGSQIYAMTGMRTRLHLLANEVGIYEGLNTQYNGEGFSDMNFKVEVVTPQQFKAWVEKIKKSPLLLNDANYQILLKPSINEKPAFYSNVKKDFFDNVVQLYLHTYGTIHPRQTNVTHGKE